MVEQIRKENLFFFLFFGGMNSPKCGWNNVAVMNNQTRTNEKEKNNQLRRILSPEKLDNSSDDCDFAEGE
jgi:hypothetical protein